MTKHDGTEVKEAPQRLPDRVLSLAADVVYWVIAVITLAASVALIVSQVNLLVKIPSSSIMWAMIGLLDRLLLIFVFLTLLFAVRTSLRYHKIVAEPFLIVGILVCIRQIVALSDDPARLLTSGPQFAHAVVGLGVLGGVVAVLTIAIVVLRMQQRSPADAGTESADT